MPPITLYEFNTLTKPAQIPLLEEHAVCLDLTRHIGVYKTGLFDLNGFYVEVWVNVKTDATAKIRAFRSAGRLEPYLRMISVEGL